MQFIASSISWLYYGMWAILRWIVCRDLDNFRRK